MAMAHNKYLILTLALTVCSALNAMQPQPPSLAHASEALADRAQELLLRAAQHPAVKESPTKKRQTFIRDALRVTYHLRDNSDDSSKEPTVRSLKPPENPKRMVSRALENIARSQRYAERAGIDSVSNDALSEDRFNQAFPSTQSSMSDADHQKRHDAAVQAAMTRKQNLLAEAARGAKPISSYFKPLPKSDSPGLTNQ